MGFKVSRRGRIYWRDSHGRFASKGSGRRYGPGGRTKGGGKGGGRSKGVGVGKSYDYVVKNPRRKRVAMGVSRGKGGRIYRRPKYGYSSAFTGKKRKR